MIDAEGALAAWRANRVAQAESSARSATVAEAWRQGAAQHRLAGVAETLEGAEDGIVARANALLADEEWLPALLTPLLAGAAADPFFQPPLSTGGSAGIPTLLLARGAAATAVLTILPPGAPLVANGKCNLVALYGPGRAGLRTLNLASGSIATAQVRPGEVLRLDGRRAAHALEADGPVAAVIVSVQVGASDVARVYADDGRLLSSASTDEGASRAMLLLELLRGAGHSRRAEACAALIDDPAPALRWAALRSWLLADGEAALPALHRVAADDSDAAVRSAAATTLARAGERQPCPA